MRSVNAEGSANKVAYEEHGPFWRLPSSSFHVNPAAARDRGISDFCDKLCPNFNELIGAHSQHPNNELCSSCHIDRDTIATKTECSACVDVREELSPLDILLISSLASPETWNPKENLPPIEEMLYLRPSPRFVVIRLLQEGCRATASMPPPVFLRFVH